MPRLANAATRLISKLPPQARFRARKLGDRIDFAFVGAIGALGLAVLAAVRFY
jgi:hypothetical protein